MRNSFPPGGRRGEDASVTQNRRDVENGGCNDSNYVGSLGTSFPLTPLFMVTFIPVDTLLTANAFRAVGTDAFNILQQRCAQDINTINRARLSAARHQMNVTMPLPLPSVPDSHSGHGKPSFFPSRNQR